jgi:hypothetical protein
MNIEVFASVLSSFSLDESLVLPKYMGKRRVCYRKNKLDKFFWCLLSQSCQPNKLSKLLQLDTLSSRFDLFFISIILLLFIIVSGQVNNLCFLVSGAFLDLLSTNVILTCLPFSNTTERITTQVTMSIDKLLLQTQSALQGLVVLVWQIDLVAHVHRDAKTLAFFFRDANSGKFGQRCRGIKNTCILREAHGLKK